MRWQPYGGTNLHCKRPEIGQIVGHDYQAWRVVDIRDLPDEKWTERDREYANYYKPPRTPYMIVLRPAQDDPTWTARSGDVHLRCTANVDWYTLPEHYSVCVQCGDIPPCRHVVGERAGRVAINRLERFENAGVCPACSEVVTTRQQSVTFDLNVELPGGPPVTFHLRRQCRWKAVDYDRRHVAANPEARPQLHCTGTIHIHADNTYTCSSGTDCTGGGTEHPINTVCDCCTRHPRGCHHDHTTTNRASKETLHHGA